MIYINRNKDISNDEWYEIIKKMSLEERVANAKTIVIKPNFAAGTYVDPKTHVISDMWLLKSAISFLHFANKNAVIYIAEADSTGFGFAYLKFEHLGLPDSLGLNKDVMNQVKLLDLSRDRLQRCEDKLFKRYTSVDKQLWLSKTLLNADLILNLSNLKTHAVTGYTGACKNLFGCLPDFEKYHNHPYIHYVIHDLVIAIKPHLNVVDAFYGMEKNGPVQGIDVNTGYRVFSDNPIEADVYSSKTIDYHPKKVKYIKLLCKDCGIDINIPVDVIKKYQKPSKFLRVMNSLGLAIQRCGAALEIFGHSIHSCPTPFVLLITIARPILLKLFDYQKLREIKRKFIK